MNTNCSALGHCLTCNRLEDLQRKEIIFRQVSVRMQFTYVRGVRTCFCKAEILGKIFQVGKEPGRDIAPRLQNYLRFLIRGFNFLNTHISAFHPMYMH